MPRDTLRAPRALERRRLRQTLDAQDGPEPQRNTEVQQSFCHLTRYRAIMGASHATLILKNNLGGQLSRAPGAQVRCEGQGLKPADGASNKIGAEVRERMPRSRIPSA